MKIAIVSGYFNPLHVGHLDYLEAAKKISDKLIVIVNSDHQVVLKGSTPFMNQSDRVTVVKALKYVDRVYLSTDKDESVLETLKHILVQNQANGRNHFMFCNGGDRSNTNTPEERLCSSNSYQLTSIYNIGGEKRESSSEIISKAAKKDGVSEI